MEAPPMVQISFFHLMPYAEVEAVDRWPVPHKLFDPVVGQRLYNQYLDQMALADELGFHWVGCNEHHSTPYGLMSNPNLIGGAPPPGAPPARPGQRGDLVPPLKPPRGAEE